MEKDLYNQQIQIQEVESIQQTTYHTIDYNSIAQQRKFTTRTNKRKNAFIIASTSHGDSQQTDHEEQQVQEEEFNVENADQQRIRRSNKRKNGFIISSSSQNNENQIQEDEQNQNDLNQIQTQFSLTEQQRQYQQLYLQTVQNNYSNNNQHSDLYQQQYSISSILSPQRMVHHMNQNQGYSIHTIQEEYQNEYNDGDENENDQSNNLNSSAETDI